MFVLFNILQGRSGRQFLVFGALAAAVGITHQFTPKIKGLNVPDTNIFSEDTKPQHLVLETSYLVTFLSLLSINGLTKNGKTVWKLHLVDNSKALMV